MTEDKKDLQKFPRGKKEIERLEKLALYHAGHALASINEENEDEAKDHLDKYVKYLGELKQSLDTSRKDSHETFYKFLKERYVIQLHNIHSKQEEKERENRKYNANKYGGKK